MTPSPSGKQEFSMKDSPVVDMLKGTALKKLNNIGMTVRSPSAKLQDFQKAYDAIDDVESDIGALGSIKFMGEPPGMKLDKDTAKHSGTVAKAVSAGKPPPPLPKSDVATAPTIPQKKHSQQSHQTLLQIQQAIPQNTWELLSLAQQNLVKHSQWQ